MGRDREQTGSNQGTWATEDPLQELGTMAEEDHQTRTSAPTTKKKDMGQRMPKKKG